MISLSVVCLCAIIVSLCYDLLPLHDDIIDSYLPIFSLYVTIYVHGEDPSGEDAFHSTPMVDRTTFDPGHGEA